MNIKELSHSVSFCGLICLLCRPGGECSCRSNNHCGKRLSPQGCYQYNCCIEKGLSGCWECNDFLTCDKDMFSQEKDCRIRAFVRCIREDGLEQFSHYIIRNQEHGIIYHRKGISGDYDGLGSEEAVLNILRKGK